MRQEAERLGALLAHEPILATLRSSLRSKSTPIAARKSAFQSLGRLADRNSAPIFLDLLDDDSFRAEAINVLARYNDSRVPAALLDRFGDLSTPEKRRAVATLTSRASFAEPFLNAIVDGRIPRSELGSFQIRALRSLRNTTINELIVKVWGEARETGADRAARIAELAKIYREAPLWAYSAGAGKAVFDKTCASCHASKTTDGNLGPNLTGSGRNGVEYFLESVVDPNAVVGEDFRATLIITQTGAIVSGVVQEETDEAVIVRTPDARQVIRKSDILSREKRTESVMPEGLFGTLKKREIIELLKYLTSL